MSVSPSSAMPTGGGGGLAVSGDERALLCSLVESGQFGPGVKALFDRGWGGSSAEYAVILQASAADKQAHIKAICEEHYAEFLAGIEHLLSVKVDLSELRSMALGLNQSVQQSGRAVLASGRQLNEQRRLRYQINSAKQALASCASLIALARKAKQQIYHAKYFSALKTLNQLQRILHVAATNLHRGGNSQAMAAAAAAGSDGSAASSTSSPTVPLSPTGSVAVARADAAAKQQQALAASNAIRFEFIRQLERQIPLLTSKIKESVKAEFTAWLAGIAKRSQAIGELALSQLDEQLTQANKRAQAARRKDDRRSKRSKRRHEADDEEDEAEEMDLSTATAALVAQTSGGLFDAVPVNFTAVYQALHIYEHLNLAEQFQLLYKEKRQNQLMEAVQTLAYAAPPASPSAAAGGSSSQQAAAVSGDLLSAYSAVFACVCGFFLIEDHILKSGNELVSRAEIDALFEKVQGALVGHLVAHFRAVSSSAHPPSYLLQLKYLALLFCKTMQDLLGHDAALVRACLEQQRGLFEEVLVRRFRGELRTILTREKWEPLGLHDDQEHRLFVLAFGLQDPSVAVDFPCTMPFSISVPLISRTLANLVEDYFAYARYLDDAPSSSLASLAGGLEFGGGGGGSGSMRVSSAWKGHVLRCLDRALSSEVNGTFLALLQQANMPISQTVQFSINAQVLAELTCTFLEHMVARFGEDPADEPPSSSTANAHQPPQAGPSSPTGSSSYVLSSRGELMSTKLRCEDLIFELISDKIDDFLDDLTSGAHSWTPDALPPQPSDYMVDLVAYLETTFYHMAFMPDAVREAVHFTSCKHIADEMLEALASTSSNRPGACKKFNVIGIAWLNQDLHVVEAFASRCPIQNLVETFSELRQLVDLLLSGDLDALLDPPLRAARYPHLSTQKLLRVLDKFKDISLFSLSTPPQFKKLKKKNVEAVVKALQKKA